MAKGPMVKADYDFIQRSKDAALHTGSDSFVQQHHAEACDLNNIMDRWLHGGPVTHTTTAVPRYVDCDGSDFREAMDIVVQARASFDSLDARVRARFSNDPALLLDFVADKANYDEAVKLGLIEVAPEVPKEEKTPPESRNSGSIDA